MYVCVYTMQVKELILPCQKWDYSRQRLQASTCKTFASPTFLSAICREPFRCVSVRVHLCVLFPCENLIRIRRLWSVVLGVHALLTVFPDCRDHLKKQLALCWHWDGLGSFAQRAGETANHNYCKLHMQDFLPCTAAQAVAVCLKRLVWIWLYVVQGFGVAEGRPKEDMKNMANAAGQACRDFTPPGGETLDEVNFCL